MFNSRNKLLIPSLIKEIANLAIRLQSSTNSQYCLDSIKKHDYENFVCTLLLKNTARSCAIAVRSLNVEVAKIREQTSDPKIGLMRLKFWEEAITKCFSKEPKQVPQHPVAVQLFRSLMQCKLSRHHFLSLISSRREFLSQNYFNTLEDLEKYAEKSVSPVYYLILEGMDVRNLHADHAASHLGKAQGIVQQLRIIPYAKTLNTIPVPQNILIKHGISQEDILRGKSHDKLKEGVFEVASRAHQHLMKARNMLKEVPVTGRDALLPAVPVHDYLQRLQKVDYEVLHPSLQQKSRTWLFKLWFTHLRKKF